MQDGSGVEQEQTPQRWLLLGTRTIKILSPTLGAPVVKRAKVRPLDSSLGAWLAIILGI